MGRLRSYLLLTLVLGVLVGWAAAIDSGRLFDTWAFMHDVEKDTGNTITADTLGAPSSLNVTAPLSGNALDLTFNASNDAYATHYQIFRCTGSGCTPSAEITGSPIAEGSLGATCSTPSGACSYQDTGLTGGTTYCYKVATAYKVGSTLVWTSGATPASCRQASIPVTLRDLFLKSPNSNTNTACSSSTNTLVTSGASGGCTIDASTHVPYALGVWNSSSVKVTAQSNWTLTLDLDTGNPFESATLVATLWSSTGACGTDASGAGKTLIATSAATQLTADGSITLNAAPITPLVTGVLCLKIENQGADSGASHTARILTAGVSKIRGPWDP